MSPGRRIDRDEGGFESRAVGTVEPLATARSAASCTGGRNVVCTCQSGGLSPPNSLRNCWRRNSFAYPGAHVVRLPVRLDRGVRRAPPLPAPP
jgi:hypothetical protein